MRVLSAPVPVVSRKRKGWMMKERKSRFARERHVSAQTWIEGTPEAVAAIQEMLQSKLVIRQRMGCNLCSNLQSVGADSIVLLVTDAFDNCSDVDVGGMLMNLERWFKALPVGGRKHVRRKLLPKLYDQLMQRNLSDEDIRFFCSQIALVLDGNRRMSREIAVRLRNSKHPAQFILFLCSVPVTDDSMAIAVLKQRTAKVKSFSVAYALTQTVPSLLHVGGRGLSMRFEINLLKLLQHKNLALRGLAVDWICSEARRKSSSIWQQFRDDTYYGRQQSILQVEKELGKHLPKSRCAINRIQRECAR